MKITEELIDRFFRQECTAEERSAVSAYFEQYPDELDKYLGDEHWENFETSSKLHPAISQKMLDVIEQHIDKDKSKKRVRFNAIGIAASIIVVVGIALFINRSIINNRETKGDSIILKTSLLLKKSNDTVYNKTDKTMLITLKDSSSILLSGKSEIIYQLPFTQKHRDIYLKGQAFFKVAKDKTRPFTVYAGGLSTTALGTSFKITAFNADSKVSVQLFTGKVVVKQLQNRSNKDSYLTPGNMLVLDKLNSGVKIYGFNENSSRLSDSVQSKGTTVIHNSIIQFQNRSLTAVIFTLQKAYHIRINANQGLLLNKFFTGDIDTRSEKPDDVLHTIAMLNKLSLRKQGSVYTLNE